MGTNELSMRLWHERELLEMLLFKLEVQAAAWPPETVAGCISPRTRSSRCWTGLRTTGIARVVDAATVAEEWGAPEGATLRELVEHAPTDPWRDVFTDHLRVLTQLVAEIGQLARRQRAAADVGDARHAGDDRRTRRRHRRVHDPRRAHARGRGPHHRHRDVSEGACPPSAG
ncbi:flagellar protein FlgN [Microbacterium elymi]|uniref:Flagellar protein FlgN n=1 Tax=Microbacterium elymi TaxID=2909587 RepID=A0ABY5NLI5_9MICO|nr:flagellar protein FlgN [Microbacterium elymi]UUT36049.1 flagellar protein FlgN [Microbacterium elymi]